MLSGNGAAISNCSFINCSTSGYGGAIAIDHDRFDQYVMISNSTFMNNYALQSGGAIYGAPSLTIYSSLFLGNNATAGGGGLYYNAGGLADCTFIGNNANIGGAIFANVTDMMSFGSMNQCLFHMNRAFYGGGVYCYQSLNEWQIINSMFTSNFGEFGGGMALGLTNYTTNFSLQNCTFQFNTATNGGGLYLGAIATTDLTNWKSNTFEFNQALGSGNVSGGLLIYSDTVNPNRGISLGNLLLRGNIPRDYYCDIGNVRDMLVCETPTQCSTPDCNQCEGICVNNNDTMNQCYVNVSPPACANGKCVFSGPPKCVCNSGWKGDKCDVSDLNLITLWYFWVSIGGGLLLILILIVTVVVCRRRSEYSELNK
jgi:predicted outer membrane repeat protein